jgi:hypothetical protein
MIAVRNRLRALVQDLSKVLSECPGSVKQELDVEYVRAYVRLRCLPNADSGVGWALFVMYASSGFDELL